MTQASLGPPVRGNALIAFSRAWERLGECVGVGALFA